MSQKVSNFSLGEFLGSVTNNASTTTLSLSGISRNSTLKGEETASALATVNWLSQPRRLWTGYLQQDMRYSAESYFWTTSEKKLSSFLLRRSTMIEE
jgi:hypothetical protein